MKKKKTNQTSYYEATKKNRRFVVDILLLHEHIELKREKKLQILDKNT